MESTFGGGMWLLGAAALSYLVSGTKVVWDLGQLQLWSSLEAVHCSIPGLLTAKVPLSLSRQSLYMVWDTVPVSGELISQMSQEYQGLLSLFFSAESAIISYCYLQLLTWSDPDCPSLVKTSPQNLYTYKQQCIFIFKNGSLH